MGAAARKVRRRANRSGAITTGLLIVVPLSLVFMPTAILMAAGMIPTLVAFLADRDPERTAPMTVGALNFVGCMAFVIRLWQGNNTLAGALAMLSDPFVWFGMYGAAAVGWGFYYGIPPVVAGWIAMRAQARIDKLKAEQEALVAEWGPEVRGEPAGAGEG
jgi:hypothetical protein